MGLQALIREKYPLAVYTHCTGYYLNPVIGSSCNLPVIRNVVGIHHLPSEKRSVNNL